MSEARVKSLSWLEARLRQWQRCCRMLDWKITVEIVRERDLANPRWCAESSIRSRLRKATLRLQDPLDHDPVRHGDYDMELNLAHEFSHVITHHWPYPKDDDAVETVELEWAMDCIANGLCAIPADFGQQPVTLKVGDTIEVLGAGAGPFPGGVSDA